jgi:hypothetical protein
MEDTEMPEGWEVLRSWLPADLDGEARRHGFLRRARGLQESERWLRMFFMHVMGGLSLKQTVVRADELGWAKVSSVALFKRLRQAEGWLQALSRHLLEEQRRQLGLHQWPWRRSLRVIDATDVQEPGSTGTALRVHYSIRLPELACDHYELSDHHGGEKLGRFSFAPGEWVLADRGYSHRAGVAHVLKAQAQITLRWNAAIFPLLDGQGRPFPALKWLKTLPALGAKEVAVRFIYGGEEFSLRLCARRKARAATERSQRKIKDKARRNGTQTIDPASLELAGYILVLTSISPTELSTSAVLEFYRYRWQIELYFKRLKTLLDAGHVPKSNDASAKAWMQAKILSALLLERVLLEARCFSPWGYRA